MAQELKFFKVSELPTAQALEPNAFYFVVDGDYAESYVTSKGTHLPGQQPSGVEAKLIGNSTMINELIEAAEKELIIVDDITARNALSGLSHGQYVLVVDASDDENVESGSALYLWDDKLPGWILLSIYDQTTVVLKMEWETIEW